MDRGVSPLGRRLLTPQALHDWIDARKRHRLSDAHVQMARELGMNPRKLGNLDHRGREPWKFPLGAFIEELYAKRLGKRRPDVVVSIEERARRIQQKRAARTETRRLRRESTS